jgi:ribulose-phosphate 3-epimerase
LKRVATRPLDVHLMIEKPERYVDDFVAAGAAMLSVHVEAVRHLNRVVAHIRSRGVKAGVAINPATPAVALEEIAADLDFVLVMSVNPGFGGQQFIPQSLYKLRRIREVLDRAGSTAPIEIDGGIDETNAADVVSAGASILVAGHAIFGAGDPESATRALRAACTSATPFHA